MSTEVVLQVRDLSFAYGKQPVFTELSFEIYRGEVFVLLGPNGCGKSTLIDCLLSFLKPSQGTIALSGQLLSEFKAHQLAQQIAYVPQTHKKTFSFTVREIVLMGRAAYTPSYSTPREEDLAIAEEAIAVMGITHLADRPYVHLSGGESQLVMLARAIAQQSHIIVLDEPTAHLDHYNEMLVLDKLTELNRQKGRTVIMSTHAPNHIFYLLNRGLSVHTAMLKNGVFLCRGHGEEIITEQAISSLYHINSRLVETKDAAGRPMKQIISLSVQEQPDKS